MHILIRNNTANEVTITLPPCAQVIQQGETRPLMPPESFILMQDIQPTLDWIEQVRQALPDCVSMEVFGYPDEQGKK